MRLAFALIALFLAVNAHAAPAGYKNCAEVSNICTAPNEARVVDGIEITRACWDWKRIYRCDRPNRVNHCAAISATEGCAQTGEARCIARDSTGACARYSIDYECGTKLKRTGGVVLLDSQYTISNDKLVSECTSEEANKQCFVASETCTAPNQTRIVNGKSVFKKCWAWTRTYNCLHSSSVHDCDTLIDNADCTEGESACLAWAGEGGKTCVHRERRFSCKTVETKETGEVVCGETRWCAGGVCEDVKHKPNTGFGDAVTSLNAAFNIGKEFSADYDASDPQNVRIFRGRTRVCRKWPLTGSTLRNCCTDKGVLSGVVQCRAGEIELAQAAKMGVTRHYNSYCSRKNILKMCLEKKEEHCVFDSKLARLVIEAAHSQLSISYPTACNGLAVGRIKEIDFSKVDWTAAFGDIYSKLSLPEKKKFTARAVEGVEDFYKRIVAEQKAAQETAEEE